MARLAQISIDELKICEATSSERKESRVRTDQGSGSMGALYSHNPCHVN